MSHWPFVMQQSLEGRWDCCCYILELCGHSLYLPTGTVAQPLFLPEWICLCLSPIWWLPGTLSAALVITAGSSVPHWNNPSNWRARLSWKWNTNRITLDVSGQVVKLVLNALSIAWASRKGCAINAAPKQCFHQHSYSSLASSERLFRFLIITIRSWLKTSFPDTIELCPVKVFVCMWTTQWMRELISIHTGMRP